MSLSIIATPLRARELRPGDLFSTHGPDYWENVAATGSLGERVWIRMETPAEVAPDGEEVVYRIEIVVLAARGETQ